MSGAQYPDGTLGGNCGRRSPDGATKCERPSAHSGDCGGGGAAGYNYRVTWPKPKLPEDDGPRRDSDADA